jgi:hypothetical protein
MSLMDLRAAHSAGLFHIRAPLQAAVGRTLSSANSVGFEGSVGFVVKSSS